MKAIASFLIHHSRGAVALAALFSIATGASSVGLMALIYARLHERPTQQAAAAFLALALALPVCRFVSQVTLGRIAQRALLDLRTRLSRQIHAADLRHLEETGPARLFTALADDIGTLAGLQGAVPGLLMHVTILAGCVVFLAWLSWPLLLGVTVCVGAAIAMFQLGVGRALTHIRVARATQDRLFRCFRLLTEGLKELKLNRGRADVFFAEELDAAGRTMQRANNRAVVAYAVAGSLAQSALFFVIGLLVFVDVSALGVAPATLSGFVLTLVFLIGPLEAVVSAVPALGRAAVVLDRLRTLGVDLDQHASEPLVAAPSSVAARASVPWIELSGVKHRYYTPGQDRCFTLGPIDLTLQAGEIVFVTGGNGSGKTTLAKIVTGLYAPESGAVVLDGVRVTSRNRDALRQNVSAIFSDFCLFDRLLLGPHTAAQDDLANRLLDRLELARVVTVRNGTFSTTDVSQGQRKRLALVTACLEDRPLYVFDEWAADQDPVFREFFYSRLLPELRSRGKTLLVISHDDRYFHVADRLIKLEHGQIVSDRAARPRDLAAHA